VNYNTIIIQKSLSGNINPTSETTEVIGTPRQMSRRGRDRGGRGISI